MVRYALKTAYRDGTRPVLFEPLDVMAKLAALVPRPRTNLTRFHGVLARGGFPPNSRYRERMTPVTGGKVKKSTADAEADGLEEPDLTVGKRKGLCWAKRLKRVFNIEVSHCSACGGSMKIIVGLPNHSIEDPLVIGKILSHLKARCRSQESVNRRPWSMRRHRQGLGSPLKSHGWSMGTAQGRGG